MAGRKAKVSSLTLLEMFHMHLVKFSEDTVTSLDSFNIQINKRLRMIDEKIAGKWRANLSKWEDIYREAQISLKKSSTSTGRMESEQKAREAKRKIRECEEKLIKIKEWQQKIQNELPLPKSRLLKLKTFIINDLEKSKNLLKDHIRTLQEYTDLKGGGKN